MIEDKSAAILQCRANIEAVLRFYGMPAIEDVNAQTDRVMARVTDGFVERLGRLRNPHHPERPAFSSWMFNRNHGATAIRGWREEVALCSMQLVEHNTGMMELDIDHVNPNYGLGLIVGHAWEVLRNKFRRGKTDPFRIRAGLKKRGIIA